MKEKIGHWLFSLLPPNLVILLSIDHKCILYFKSHTIIFCELLSSREVIMTQNQSEISSYRSKGKFSACFKNGAGKKPIAHTAANAQNCRKPS